MLLQGRVDPLPRFFAVNETNTNNETAIPKQTFDLRERERQATIRPMKLFRWATPVLFCFLFACVALINTSAGVEQDRKPSRLRDKEASLWPERVPLAEMGSLLIRNGTKNVSYSLWGDSLRQRYLETPVYLASTAIRLKTRNQEQIDEGISLLRRGLVEKKPVWALIFAYDDAIHPIAYRLNDQDIYVKQSEGVSESLVEQTTIAVDRPLSLKAMSEYIEAGVSDYSCRFYAQNGESLDDEYPDNDPAAIANYLKGKKVAYIEWEEEFDILIFYRLQPDGSYIRFYGPLSEALDVRSNKIVSPGKTANPAPVANQTFDLNDGLPDYTLLTCALP